MNYHCWHYIGGHEYNFGDIGGSDDFRCCHCGVVWRRDFTKRDKVEHGHGRFHLVKVKEYKQVEAPQFAQCSKAQS